MMAATGKTRLDLGGLSQDSAHAHRPEQPYIKPKLISYGDIREVTKAVGGVVGKNDGGSGKDKTG